MASRPLARAGAVLFALLVWQAAAMLLNQRLLLASPLEAAERLAVLVTEEGFAARILSSLGRIVLGFLSGLLLGTLLAVLAGRFPLFELMLRPFMLTVKSVPVASFIILALIWLSSSRLSAFISFLMVLPVIYSGVLGGIQSIDPRMTEMTRVLRVPWARRLYYVWLPAVRPFLTSACSAALGLSWKAGIAAEVIGIPSGSMGEALYEAKIYLSTADLFAWTAVIVLLSLAFERLFLLLLRLLFDGLVRLSQRSERRLRLASAGDSEDAPSGTPDESLSRGDILLEGVDKSFGENAVLRGLTARFPAGRVTCVMGPSGVGKTTLVNLLLGLTEPDGGVIVGLPGRASAVFQEDRLCEDFTAAANARISCGRQLPAGEPGRLLTLLGLDDSVDLPVRGFSGGMKRRTALARALLSPGSLLVLDEPFKGLDPDCRARTAEVIRSYAAGRTVILVTHSEEEAALLGADIVRITGES